MELRYYQQEAVDAVFSDWSRGIEGNYVICLPTGSGKSIVNAEIIRLLYTRYKARILMLTHAKELIQQNHDKILDLWPKAPVGLYSAGLGIRDLHAPIVFAGIQSIEKHIHKTDPFDIVMVDECHAISTDENTRYKKVLNTLKLMNPNMRVIGLSATPFRMSTGWIHKGEDRIFHHLCYNANILDLIEKGYLCKIHSKSGAVAIDTKSIAHRGGEFVAGELEKRAMEGDVTRLAVADMVSRAMDRKCWIVFACGIDHAKQINDCFLSHGVASKIVTGETPKEERDRIIKDHKSGRIKCVVNVAVLTTGYDNPSIDMIGLLRPTESPGLFIQILGRGMRIAEDKEDCLVLDYSGNCERFGPIDKINPERKQSDGDGIPPCKSCPECTSIVMAGVSACPYCGHEFPPPPMQIKHVADDSPILSTQIEPKERKVKKTYFSVHKKPDKKPCVKIEYEIGFGESYYDWLFPESQFRAQYIKLCKQFGMLPYSTAQEWVDNSTELEGPHTIFTIPDGKYHKVVRREFYEDRVPF